MTKYLFLLILLLLPPRVQAQDKNIDVQHYAFDLTLSDEQDQISGTARVTVIFTEDGVNAFGLDLIGKTGETGMQVSAIQRSEMDVAYTHAGDRINITVDPPARAGEKRIYTIAYAGVPADGLIIAENKYGQRTFFGDNWPNRARHWLPTNDHPSDKATVAWGITAPEHYQVIGNGLLQEETDLLDGTRRTVWRTEVPLATKVTVIGAAQFAVQYAGELGDIPIQHWVYPQDREAGFHDFGTTNGIMEFFIDNIGPFSYEKLANVQSKTRYGGMENASNIFYSENAISGNRANERLVAHEIAHQWFGNSATEADWQHIWLSEGFATYFAQLYMEHTYGRERFVDGMQNARNTVLGFYARVPDAPLVNPNISDPNQHLNPNSYQKGAWVLHMLRHKIGDDAFWQGIQDYYASYRDKNATSAQLQEKMEAASGMDLSDFFQQWLYQPGQPVLEGNWRYAGGKININVSQAQQTPLFDVPLEVAVVMPDGSRRMETVRVTGKENTFAIDVDAAPADVILDPDTWLLADIDFRKN